MDSIDNLQCVHTLRASNLIQRGADGLNVCIYKVEVLTKHGRECLDSIVLTVTLACHSLHDNVTPVVVVQLVRKESSTIAVTSETTEAAPSVTEEKTKEESKDAASPAIAAEETSVVAAIQGEQGGKVIVATTVPILGKRKHFCVCHNSLVFVLFKFSFSLVIAR